MPEWEALKRLLFLSAAMPKGPKKIGGIPVLYDNAAYPANGGYVEDYIEDEAFFITGVWDTGSTSSKSVTYRRYTNTLTGGGNTGWRSFNDLSARCAGDWTISGVDGDRTVSASGRFVLYTVCKAKAADAFMYYTVDGVKHYLFKGDNVTE